LIKQNYGFNTGYNEASFPSQLISRTFIVTYSSQGKQETSCD